MTGMLLVLTVMALFGAFAAAAAAQGAPEPVKYVCNFAGPSDVAAFKVTGGKATWSSGTEDDVPVEGTALEPTKIAGGAMYISMEPLKSMALEYSASNGLPADWTGYEDFVMYFENGSEFLINLHLTVRDKSGREYLADNLWIMRSRNPIIVPLSEMRTASGEALDFARIDYVKIDILSKEKFGRDLWTYKWLLVKGGAPVVRPDARTMMINFAPLGAPPVPGARLITERTAYAPWRGIGWTAGTERLMGTNFKRPEYLTASWVFGEVGDKGATLRVDLPDGKYRARLYGGNYSEKVLAVRSFKLSANGRAVASRSVDAGKYYTTEGHFFGLDKWYEEGEDVYAKYVAPFYQVYDFEFEAKSGKAEFTWTGVLAAFGLLITPAEGDAFAKAAARVEDARRADLETNVVRPEKPKEDLAVDKVETQRGFVVWSRPWRKAPGLYDYPSDGERNPKVIRIKGAGGERRHAALTVTPLRDLGKVKIDVSDLAPDMGGAKIPASAVAVRVLRYMWSGWPAELQPSYLYPSAEAPAAQKYNRTFWLTLTVPEAAAGGVYRGTVHVKAASGGTVSLPVELEVRPFALVKDYDVSYAFWRTSDYNMNYMLKYFLPDKMDYYRKLMDAEAKNQREHGATGFYFNAPIIKGVKGDHVILDFSVIEEEVRAAKKYGLAQRGAPGMVFTLPDVARYLMKETRYGDFMEPEDMSPALPEAEQLEEFSDLFNKRYIDAVSQIHSFFEKHGMNVLIYPADEPRERNTNRWNRNLADTLRYCKMIREHVPGARIYVDPMRDENAGVDYLPICDVVDVIGTHPWDQSERIVKRAGNEALPALWYFNSITWDRYDFGLEVAAADAKGFWQWHYQWSWLPFQPFHPGFKWGVTLPGPDGPFDMPAHEHVAQSIDDLRYLLTLEQRVEAAKNERRADNAVAAAEETLASFYDRAPAYPTRDDYGEHNRGKERDVIAGKSLDQWRDAFADDIAGIDAAQEP